MENKATTTKGKPRKPEAQTLAQKYAARILAALPPKQAELYQKVVLENCEFLEVEAKVGAVSGTYKNLERFLEQANQNYKSNERNNGEA